MITLQRLLLSIPCILCLACGGSSDPSESVPRVNTYEECVLSGGLIQEVYPPICVLPDGTQFEAPLFFEEEGKACEDRCGDGVCQEYTCLAIGCPCSETADSCPVDCS